MLCDKECQAATHTSMAVSTIDVLSNSLLIVVIVLDLPLIIRRGPWATIFNLAIADFNASLSKFLTLDLGCAFKITVPNEIMSSCFYFWMLEAAG